MVDSVRGTGRIGRGKANGAESPPAEDPSGAFIDGSHEASHFEIFQIELYFFFHFTLPGFLV